MHLKVASRRISVDEITLIRQVTVHVPSKSDDVVDAQRLPHALSPESKRSNLGHIAARQEWQQPFPDELYEELMLGALMKLHLCIKVIDQDKYTEALHVLTVARLWERATRRSHCLFVRFMSHDAA